MVPRRSHRLSVLVSDDDRSVLEAVVELLGAIDLEMGLQIHRAHNGREALSILLACPIDLSILDVHMPDMTGLEVMRRYLAGPLLAAPGGVAARVARPRLPAIFMSGEADDEIRAEVDALGLLLVDKPFHPDVMRAEVRRALFDRFD